jgi:hypothetical protein
LTGIQRERRAWYKNRIPNWDTYPPEKRFKIVSHPAKHLRENESPFCKCGHHVNDHGYNELFGEEEFCFHSRGDRRHKRYFVDYDGNRIKVNDDLARAPKKIRRTNGVFARDGRCSCDGFEPHRIAEEEISK